VAPLLAAWLALVFLSALVFVALAWLVGRLVVN
jgi:hypothetical protein